MIARAQPLPPALKRHFDGYGAESLADPRYRPFMIERLLEWGETEDLRWLTAQVDEEELRSWLRARGGRRLSQRARRFWCWLLDVELESLSVASRTEDLWPL